METSIAIPADYAATMLFDTHELAWAAGFFDGEGTFSVRKKGDTPVARVSQIDRRVLDRFALAVHLPGRVYGPYVVKNPRRKPIWAYHVSAFEHFQHVVAVLWNYLSPVKRAQAVSVFGAYRAYRDGCRHRLSADVVRAVRARYDELQGRQLSIIASEFDITASNVCVIGRRKTWHGVR